MRIKRYQSLLVHTDHDLSKDPAAAEQALCRKRLHQAVGTPWDASRDAWDGERYQLDQMLLVARQRGMGSSPGRLRFGQMMRMVTPEPHPRQRQLDYRVTKESPASRGKPQRARRVAHQLHQSSARPVSATSSLASS